MKRSILVGSVLTGFCLTLLAALPIQALALQSEHATGSPATPEYSEAEQAAIREEIKVFANVPVSIHDAIATAERHTPGAKVIDVSFDGRAGNLVYKIKAYHGNETWSGTIDAWTGKIMEGGVVVPVSSLDVKNKLELDDFRIAGVYLSDAVGIAEKSIAGKAVSAGLGEADGKLLFLVVVVTDGFLKEVSITPNREQNRINKSDVGRKTKSLDHKIARPPGKESRPRGLSWGLTEARFPSPRPPTIFAGSAWTTRWRLL
jgi:uncharacterized membrane protein YkoI